MTPARLALAALLAVIALGPVLLPESLVTMLNYTGLYSLVAIGLALLTGIGGMTSFGQAAFVGVGAYATAYFSATVGLSPWIALLIGLAFTAVTALMLGALTLRLAGQSLLPGREPPVPRRPYGHQQPAADQHLRVRVR